MKRDGERSVGGSLHPVKLARVAACLRALLGLGQAPTQAARPIRFCQVAEGPQCLLPHAPAQDLGVVMWLYAPCPEAQARLRHEAKWFGLDARSVVAVALPQGALRAGLAAALAAPGVGLVVLDGRLGWGGKLDARFCGAVAQVLHGQDPSFGPAVVLLRVN